MFKLIKQNSILILLVAVATVSIFGLINTASATPAININGHTSPSAPQNFVVTASNGTASFSWTAPNDGGSPITNYEIYRGLSSNAEMLLAEVGNVLSYIDTGLNPEIGYYYKVAAKNNFGIGEFSNEVSVAPVIPACTGADVDTCTAWGTCSNNTQTCIGSYVKTPAGCSGSVSAPTQSCTVAPLIINGDDQPSQTPNGAVTYGVFMDNSTGNLSGYAWSSSVGWIKFGDLSGWPTGGNTTPSNAKIAFGKLVGWARACSATIGGNCSSMQAKSGGWDGWISLDGGTKYGVSLSGNNFSGFAWGSDVIGWTDFSDVKLESSIAGLVTVDITSASSSVASGTATMISWTSEGANSCSFKKNESVITPSSATAGSFSSGALIADTTFFATCVNNDHTATGTDHVTVYMNDSPNKPEEESNCTNPDGCEILWDEESPADCSYNIETDTFTCVDPNNPNGSPITIDIPLEHRSTCTPSQNFVNRTTTWTLSNSETKNGGAIGKVNWKGTDILTRVTTGVTTNKLYLTVGLKTLTAVTKIIPAIRDPYISACYATTTMKLDTGGGEEI